jgi:hypothetical protein
LANDFDEENIDKIFQEITNKLDSSIQFAQDQAVEELSIKDFLFTQKSLIDTLGFINQLILSIENESDFLSSQKEESKYITTQINEIYKNLEDFNDYMIEFLGEDIEFIFELEEEDDEDDE